MKREEYFGKKTRKKSRRLRLFGITAVVLLCFIWLGRIWWNHIESQAHLYPDYEKVSIEPLLYKEGELRWDDYQLLFQQTGMGTAGVDYLFSQGLEHELLELQEIYFAEVAVDCQSNTLITREERTEQISPIRTRASIPYVEEGDILISFNCHVFGWRNGHVGIVVDAKKRLTLEASQLGTQSKLVSMNHWERYPSFVVLRLKNASKEEREAIAGYAAEYLTDIPYQLEAGMLARIRQRLKKEWIPEKQAAELRNEQQADRWIQEWNTEEQQEWDIPQVEGTHCAHLVWYAYNRFGHDVDSDGGFIVTPRDLYESGLWEVVQIYGMERDGENFESPLQ